MKWGDWEILGVRIYRLSRGLDAQDEGDRGGKVVAKLQFGERRKDGTLNQKGEFGDHGLQGLSQYLTHNEIIQEVIGSRCIKLK